MQIAECEGEGPRARRGCRLPVAWTVELREDELVYIQGLRHDRSL